jgi:gamma-D-glutamyl-L-lysine dipeptidyl-peptidase
MFVVSVPVATLWSGPDAVRPRDAPAVADEPDIAAWIAAMTPAEQAGTAVVTQLLAGERVLVEDVRPDGWARVVALDQPAGRLDPRGYPGWLRLAHLRRAPSGASGASGVDVVEHARTYLGAVYVWGGLSRYGLDCSGLVHLVWRHFGVVVPRDAAEQAAASTPVPEPEPGDLYFFAHPGRPIHHVGIVAGPGTMLHASSVRHRVVEEPLPPDRVATLVAVTRVDQGTIDGISRTSSTLT